MQRNAKIAAMALGVLGAGFRLATAQALLPVAVADASHPVQERVDALVGAMTTEEKISQLMDRAPAIPRLGIPEYNWWNEGLHGAGRSGYATLFPQAIGMAATWDSPLVHEEAGIISEEARAKYNDAIAHGIHRRYFGLTEFSPNINIFRDPRWGRGQETLGEDPYLTATLGVSFVKGLQGSNPKYLETLSTPKHLVAHSGPESTRHKADVHPTDHDLYDTYLPAFRATLTDGNAGSVMCSYNALNGSPTCSSTFLLQETIRGAWGFKGYITSDCGAVDDIAEGHHTFPDKEHAAAAALRTGLDMECGDSFKLLGKALEDGLVQQSDIDTAVKRLFIARIKLGMFDPPKDVAYSAIPFSTVDSQSHRAVSLKASEESMVLLKNDGILPLKSSLKTIAVVGPNAQSLAAIEGNYNAIPSNPVLPIDGMEQGFTRVRILYAQGAPYSKELDVPVARSVFGTGLKAEYFNNASLTGTPAAVRVDRQIDFDWSHAAPVTAVSSTAFSVRWTGTIAMPQAGDYQFGLQVGRCSECANKTDQDEIAITLDGKPVDTSHTPPSGLGWNTRMPEIKLTFTDTRPHTIQIEYRHNSADMPGQASLRWFAPVDVERQEAVDIAKKADVVVAFVGLSPELEGEEMPVHVPGFAGGDRTSLDLPQAQQDLLKALKETGKPLVVVALNGSALALNWEQQNANAILEAWYPGEAGGTAIANTLSGRSNPGGKLPLTFYTGVEQLPAFDDYSMSHRTYRYFDGQPLYRFGFGLTYTHFAFSGLNLSTQQLQAGQPLTVSATIRNTGKLAGDQVAELYLVPPKAPGMPKLALRAFTRVHLAAGESKPVTWTLDARQLSFVDEAGKTTVTPGDYTVSVGSSQPDDAVKDTEGVSGKFSITGTQQLPR